MKGYRAMLMKKLNLKTLYYLVSIYSVIYYYIRLDIELIDVLYLIFVLFFVVKYIFNEVLK